MDEISSKGLLKELQLEMTPDHLLYGLDIKVIADRDGATDDILIKHANDPERYTVVHLTWTQKQEIDGNHPSIECDGSFIDFIKYENSFRHNQ